MNYLAHIFLARENEDWLVGNFVADFIGQTEVKNFSDAIQQGIYLHRYIDSTTDSHAIVKECTKLLHPYFRKYSPVVIDIYFDYFLCRNFSLYSDLKLQEFCARIYEQLLQRLDDMPERLRHILPNMIESNWLESYGTYDGIAYTFLRLKSRVRFDVNLDQAVEVLMNHEEELNTKFNMFFPEIQNEVKNYKKDLIQLRTI